MFDEVNENNHWKRRSTRALKDVELQTNKSRQQPSQNTVKNENAIAKPNIKTGPSV